MITQNQLIEILDYDQSTGLFRWKTRPPSHFKTAPAAKSWNTRMVGRVAGATDGKGYIHITINYRFYRAHRLAWLYMTGENPDGYIDHINRVKTDNRFCNLRVVSPTGNNLNRAANKNAASRYKGVSRHTHGRWQAQTKIAGVPKHLGLYDTEIEASAAYVAFMREHHGKEFSS